MKRETIHWNRIWMLALAAVLLLGVAACSDDDDDPVVPIVEEDPVVRAVSPDSLAELVTVALAEGDTTLLAGLLAGDFRYAMPPRLVSDFELATDYLNLDEMLQAAGNLLGGRREAENVLGVVWDDIESISVNSFVKLEDWEEADEFSIHPGSQTALYSMELAMPFRDGTGSLSCDFLLTLYAEEYVTDDEGEPVSHWKLLRAEDSFLEVGKFATDELSLSEVLCGHLKIGVPEGELTVTSTGSFPILRIYCEVTGARDDVHGLAVNAYNFVELAGDWVSYWRALPNYERELEDEGEITVLAYVRNRWNYTLELSQTLTVEREDPPTATSTTVLMLNFRDTYELMIADGLGAQLHPDFRMILLPETRDAWGWSADYDFDRATFEAILANLFGGQAGTDPGGNAVHPIDRIDVELLEQQADWQTIPGDDPYFGDTGGVYAPFRITMSHYDAYLTHRFLVQQQVLFYAVPVDEGGETVYRLIGLRGLPSARKTDEVTWDAVLALYR